MRLLPLALVVVGGALFSAPARPADALPGVVFVADDIYAPKYEVPGKPRSRTGHWRDGYLYHRATSGDPLERSTAPSRPGRNLYTLIPARPDGTLRRITHLADGEVFGPEPSYDGRQILFSMRRDGEDWFNLYQIDVDGTGLVQLTDGPANDISGVYLPDGRIVFISDRSGYLEEYHEERTETLWIMNADGRGMRQLTYNPGTAFEPTVLADGRILFSLWDTFLLNVPPADKHETYLMTVRPDGTEESHFFGAGEHLFFNRERHSGVALTQARQWPGGRILVQSEMGPSVLDTRRGLSAQDSLWPVFPCTTSVQLGGATHRVHLSPTGSRSTPYPLVDGRFLFSASLPGARDLGLYVADPRSRRVELVFNDPHASEFDARPILCERPRPAVLPAKEKHTDRRAALDGGPRRDRVAVSGRARFVITGARLSDLPERQHALARARYLRVIEALPTAVTSSSHTSLATQILGAVPILADGSASFEAPADTPLFLEPLDAAGRRIDFDWPLPETSIPIGSRPIVQEMSYITACADEIKSCHGCHAARHLSAGPGASAEATLRAPVAIERELTDVLYRRNEPEVYRSSGRLGESPRYRPWLTSPNADLRRRACELLAETEDEARADARAIAALMSDDAVEPRRAAAQALARLGSPAETPELLAATADEDWQVRFHAAAALEAITGCIAPNGDAAGFYRRMAGEAGGPEGLRSTLAAGPEALKRFGQQETPELLDRWLEAVGRLGPSAPEAARAHVRRALQVPVPPPVAFQPVAGMRQPLVGQPPPLGAIRAAGWTRDARSVRLLVPWLERHEYWQYAGEAAVALGRIGTREAVAALWQALRRDVPERRPYLNRYFQHGPRPEEYDLLRGLILAGAAPRLEELPLAIGLLPGTFQEKARFEDRLRPESQRVLLVRTLLERAGLRRRAVALLVDVLRGGPGASGDPLYAAILAGINLERPYAEHQRPFPVVSQIEPEQAVWLLGCLATDRSEVPERLVAPLLASENHRERIDAAVLLDLLGFGPATATALAREAEKPYAFSEITSIGKGRLDPNFRDKCYMAMALAHHVEDVATLHTLADPLTRYRDVRYGLAVGLGRRGEPDAIPLLARMATSDPIAVIRRQARQSLRDLQEGLALAGKEVPQIELPDELPYEHWYAPRGLSWPGAVVLPPPAPAAPGSPADLAQQIAAGLREENYRNLNNSNNQAPGATRMMVDGIDPFCRAVHLVALGDPEGSRALLDKLLGSPYPVAHYLSLSNRTRPDPAEPEQALAKQLKRFARSGDTVGFYWACEALACRGVASAIPELVEFAWEQNPAGVHGPAGMALGYPAARAIGRLAGQPAQREVRRLLAARNIWLRAGALSGLADARAPGVQDLLRRVLGEPQSGLVHSEAAVGLTRLGATEDKSTIVAGNLDARVRGRASPAYLGCPHVHERVQPPGVAGHNCRDRSPTDTQ